MEEITFRKIDDMHCHLRQGEVLPLVLRYTGKYCKRAVVMPNTRPPILNAQDALAYQKTIKAANGGWYDFEPLMTIEIRDDTTPEIIREAKKAGVVAGKVYPRGTTTNADQGLTDFFGRSISDTFRAMCDEGMPLLLHGEIDEPRLLVTDRERLFVDRIFRRLADRFPNLKMVMEHISTRYAAETIRRMGKCVAATITAHHLCLTLNDVIGHGIKPHNACNPTPKGFDDRDDLIFAATSGNPKFFLGSDSAPHLREHKECGHGACGVFTAPVLLPLLAQIFEQVCALNRLENFTARFGAEFYGLPLNTATLTLCKKPWEVPQSLYDCIVPFMAGQTLQWQLA